MLSVQQWERLSAMENDMPAGSLFQPDDVNLFRVKRFAYI